MSLFQDCITVYRRTSTLRTSAAALTSMALAIEPAGLYYLLATVAGGTTNAGSITVSGLDPSGAVATETLVWDGSLPSLQGNQEWSSITGITSSGLAADVNLELKSVGASGSPVHALARVVQGWPCHIDHGKTSWGPLRSGTAEMEKTWIGIEYSTKWEPRSGDEVVDQYGNRYSIEGAPQHRWGSGGESHWECDVMKRAIP